MGPVNMMAIEQSKELEDRHSFLTTQQKDLVDSIAQTNEAISKIDETDARALPGSLQCDQRELPDDVLDAFRRRQGRHPPAR
jgi:hypothetical protein